MSDFTGLSAGYATRENPYQTDINHLDSRLIFSPFDSPGEDNPDGYSSKNGTFL